MLNLFVSIFLGMIAFYPLLVSKPQEDARRPNKKMAIQEIRVEVMGGIHSRNY